MNADVRIADHSRELIDNVTDSNTVENIGQLFATAKCPVTTCQVLVIDDSEGRQKICSERLDMPIDDV